jgi:ribosomal protein S15P/S13E
MVDRVATLADEIARMRDHIASNKPGDSASKRSRRMSFA